jgi:hypothetical protein
LTSFGVARKRRLSDFLVVFFLFFPSLVVMLPSGSYL